MNIGKCVSGVSSVSIAPVNPKIARRKEKMMKKTRAYKAGERLGAELGEMVNLMYQNHTAIGFLSGLKESIDEILKARKMAQWK